MQTQTVPRAAVHYCSVCTIDPHAQSELSHVPRMYDPDR
eukprot:COSAG02_NODE_58670_length_276_cov_1.169492_2_plen_38_part_01